MFVKPADLATVATSGNYNDLSNKPTIPTVNDGVLTIGSETGTQWRTLTKDEWNYIINTRSGNRFAKCQIDSQYNCLIIFPDNYTTSLSNANNADAAFTSNQLSIQDAESLINDGCVILPAACYRYGTALSNVSTYGHYWSSTSYSLNNAYCFYFNNGYVDPQFDDSRSKGFSVRLVQDSSNSTITINQNGNKVSFAPGNLQYKASTNEWRFAKHQWDFVGGVYSGSTYGNVYENNVKCDNTLISNNYDGWIDLFGYGASGYDNGQTTYQPYSTSTTNYAYYRQHLNDTTADWGYAYSQQHQGTSYTFTANQSGDTTITLSEAAFTGKSSDLNNDAGFITQNEVLTYKAIPNDWNTNSTMEALIADIDADENAVKGMSYLGTVSLTDLPAGMMQAEMVINIMANEAGLGKNITFTVTSSNTAPYHWEYTSAYSSLGTWRSFGDTEWDVYEGSN